MVRKRGLQPLPYQPVYLRHVVFALALGEGNQGNLFLLDEPIDRGDERLAHGVWQRQKPAKRRGRGRSRPATESLRAARRA